MFKPKTPRFRFFIGDMMDHFLSLPLLIRVKLIEIYQCFLQSTVAVLTKALV